MEANGWIVVERRPDGRTVKRSREVTGLVAEAIVVALRAQGRDALAMRFATPELARGQKRT
ncbi:MAG TPA: hypothetical protein VGP92_00935 [Acidimicrobiia bacterium]|nr:hypothetical protein [Acidimicrobiia bacterium]